MPRNGYNQTRTFVWSGQDLISETTPEAGTVTYQYDGAHHVTVRTDAKGQQRQYSYDAYGRLTQVRHYAMVNGTLQEQLNQRWDYYYDYDYIAGGYGNSWGRLAAVTFANEHPSGHGEQFAYYYSYSQPGRVTTERLQVAGFGPTANLSARSIPAAMLSRITETMILLPRMHALPWQTPGFMLTRSFQCSLQERAARLRRIKPPTDNREPLQEPLQWPSERPP